MGRWFLYHLRTIGRIYLNLVAQTVKNAVKNLQYRKSSFDPWVRKISWRKEWLPTPVFLPGESHGQRSLVGYSPWGSKESDTAEQLTHFFNPEHQRSSWEPICNAKTDVLFQVFLKYYHVEQLNLLLREVIGRVVVLQAYAKGWLGARRYRRVREKREKGAVAIQSGKQP